ncbi:matrin 3-like 1.1 isoform X2 [Betta splendens]|uniref:Matrin 3-like 1.1 isoform X2 n=1 Tax=Betta splendens TaxID=158456 RepID=A0A6P7NQA7_BETSP|nr:matrin 3-like 1.1 isoform X2 [Betta splendens]
MSHSCSYRGSTSDTDLRPEAGHYSSANRRHISPNVDFFRAPQESFSSYPCSSSSRGPTWAQDGALSILDSCGLEPSDLALLAELPEDVLTVDSLPYVLQQIKGKKGSVSSFAPTVPSPSFSYSSTSYHAASGSSSRIWDHLQRQKIQCPLDHVAGSLSSEQEHWRNSKTSSSVRSHPTASSASLLSSIHAVDFHCRPGPSEYGKAGRRGGPFYSQDCSSLSSATQGRRSRPTGISEPRSALPSHVYHPKPRVGHQVYQTSSTRSSSSQQAAATSIPSEKQALDFHGTCPTVFPYSCSLCDITVLSEMVWIKHINNSQHAEGQLSLLQQFPNWDCRVESVSRAKSQEKRNEEEKTVCSAQNDKFKPDTKSDKKPSKKGKVVCVKFPPQSVDETYLRKLTEPFGKIVKILMFPSLAFLELSSTEQVKDLVKFHSSYPPTVNGEQIEFSISNTFSFLQSSQVVSFTPVPTGEDGQSDLMSIVKRFGPPLYYLFLPSMAYVEMERAPDAQKLVDYYSSNTLRINNTCVKVSFSGEYRTLMRVPSANRYEEQKVSTKRTRSSSPDKEPKTESKRRQRSRDQEHERRKSKTRSREGSRNDRRTRTRSRSIDKSSQLASRDKSKTISNREGRSRSRERSSRGTRSRSRKRSNTKRKTRSRSRDKPKELSSTGSRTRSRSREKENKTSSSSTDESSSGSGEKLVEGKKAEFEPRKKKEAAPQVEVAVSSTEDSDIEGMEVIGEDGELVQEEIQNDVEAKEASEMEHQSDRTDSLEDKPMDVTVGKNEQMEDMYETKKPKGESESVMERKLEDEKASDFPVDLENCITLDDLEDDNQGEDVRDEAECLSRVVHCRNLPTSFFTDADFIRLVRDYGKAVRYLLLRQSQEAFIEMWSSSEAQKAVHELTQKPITLNGSTVFADISHKYQKLSNGWEIHLDSDSEESSSRSEQRSQAPDREDTSSKSSKEGSNRLSPEREPSVTETDCCIRTTSNPESSRNVTEKESASEKSQKEPFAETSGDDDSGLNRGSDGEKDELMQETPDSRPQPQQKPEKDDQLQCSGSVHPEPGLVGGAAEPQEPPRPVGTEFVRPVVGYFCSLCQLIYVNEEEAKQQHCSTLTHYSKYQEKMREKPMEGSVCEQ